MAKSKPNHTLLVPFWCKDEKLHFENPEQMRAFAIQFDGMRGVAEIKPLTDLDNKSRMMRFLHAALIPCVATLLVHHGYPDLSNADVYTILKDRYAKEIWYDPISQTEKYRYKDFSSSTTTTGDLVDFLNAVTYFIEHDLGGTAPKSDDWLIKKKLGYSKLNIKGQ